MLLFFPGFFVDSLFWEGQRLPQLYDSVRKRPLELGKSRDLAISPIAKIGAGFNPIEGVYIPIKRNFLLKVG